MKQARWLILGAILVLLGGLAWLFHSTFEFVKAPRYQGFQGEAATNDFLAAQRLAQRLGHPATVLRGVPGPGNLPPLMDTVVLPRRRAAMTEAQAGTLAAWVARGGTLLAEGLEPESPSAGETRDPLFRHFGARLAETRDGATDGVLECEVDHVPMKVHTGAGLQLLDLGKGSTSKAESKGAIQLLHFDRGKGHCYLFTRLGFLRNRALADLDHAECFAALALQHPGARVWIVAWEEPLSARAWLAAKALPVLVSLAALLAALLWAGAARFGPPLAAPEGLGRQFMAHLDASGAYLWRRQEGRPLLKACRQAFSRRLGHVHPAWVHLPADALCARLALHTGIAEEKVFRALRYDIATGPEALLEAIQTLELLRKKL